jgi:hypothetical protein
VSTEVKMADGTAADLVEHLRQVHQKGTKGFTEEFLANLHRTLHQSRREPPPEHTHPDADVQPPSAGGYVPPPGS